MSRGSPEGAGWIQAQKIKRFQKPIVEALVCAIFHHFIHFLDSSGFFFHCALTNKNYFGMTLTKPVETKHV